MDVTDPSMNGKQHKAGELDSSSSPSPMVLIPPPEASHENDTRAKLLRLGKVLGLADVRQCMNKWIRGGDDSVRRIQTGRYELFVKNASNKGSACFDEILRNHKFDVESTKDMLLDYAQRQALKDDRLSSNVAYKFGNFSVISTFGSVPAQAPHIDLLKPQYQFGLLLSENSPGTLAYSVDSPVETVKDVMALFQGLIQKEMPPNLVQAFQQSREATGLLKAFGNVLVPEKQLKTLKLDGPLPQGSVLSLPGSVIHAGPSCNDFRAVLFFSACPVDQAMTEYHPDTQYTGTFLCGQLVPILWRAPGVGIDERRFLVDMLIYYINQGNGSCSGRGRQPAAKRYWAGHFPVGPFRTFMQALEENSLSSSKKKQFIEKTVHNEELCCFNVEGDFDRVSAPSLLTMWDGIDTQIIVHKRRADGRVLLEYPTDKAQDLHSWEGSLPGDSYRLEMDTPGAAFDGTNGRLIATDGEEIKCFVATIAGTKRQQPQGDRPGTESTNGDASTTQAAKRMRASD